MAFRHSEQTVKIYDLMQEGKAFDTNSKDTASGVTDGMQSLKDILGNLPGFEDHGEQLDTFATGPMKDLNKHLTDQFDNLPTNLSLVSSDIEEQEALGKTPSGTLAANLEALRLGGSSAILSAASKCGGIGEAFGSIMGKANQFMGQAMGMLGNMGGAIGSMLGGGILNKIQGMANLGNMAGIPGIGQIGSMINGIAGNVTGGLGQIGGLLQNIGKMANISDLGGFAGMLGANPLEKLQQIGGMLNQMGGLANGFQSINSVSDVTGIVGHLNNAVSQLAGQSGAGELISQITGVVGQLNNLVGRGFAGAQQIMGSLGNISSALQGIAGGNFGGIISGIQGFAGNLGNITGGLSNMVGNFSGLMGNISGMMSSIGLGNISSMIGGLAGNITGAIQGAIGQAMGALNGVMGNIGGMISGEIGKLTGAISNLKRLAGALSMPALMNNICASGVLDQVGSDALKSAAPKGQAPQAPQFGQGPRGDG